MSTRYLFDTDICVFLLRRSSAALLQRIQSVPLQEQAISVITLAELLYGVQLSSRKKTNQSALDTLLRYLAVADWPRDAARHYAEIRADLKVKGQMIGSNDLLIAAHARSLGAIMVTNNIREFGRIKSLRVENWVA